MATTVPFSIYLDPQRHYLNTPFKPHHYQIFKPHNSLLLLHKLDRYNFRVKPSPFLCSGSSSPSSPTSTTASAQFEDPFRTGKFLTNEELQRLKFLEKFRFSTELGSGFLWVRVMKPEEMDVTVKMLAESFGESMLLPAGYSSLLRYLVKQYLMERRELMPHAATLIGFYRELGDDESGEEEELREEERFLAGTVEVCFNKLGASASLPTPTPPVDSPYICNMAVRKHLRRRRIGWHLLKASEELILQMSSTREVYLHCRMIDAAPFNMYVKAGYNIVKTDSILILFALQRRKHLMRKDLPVLDNTSKPDTPGLDEEFPS